MLKRVLICTTYPSCQLDEIPQAFNVQLHNARDIEIGANPVAANAVNTQKSAYLQEIQGCREGGMGKFPQGLKVQGAS